jgi:hypothetical protein
MSPASERGLPLCRVQVARDVDQCVRDRGRSPAGHLNGQNGHDDTRAPCRIGLRFPQDPLGASDISLIRCVSNRAQACLV